MLKLPVTGRIDCPSVFRLAVLLGTDGRSGRPLAAPVAAVSGALDSSEDRLSGHALGVAGQAQETHEVDEAGGQIELPAVLAGGVVEGERVVVIMEAFT